MKKKLLVVFSVAMFFAFSTIAFAKGSPTTSTEVPSYASTTKDTTEQKAVTSAAAAAVATSSTESGAVIVSRPVAAAEYQTLVATAQSSYPNCQIMAVADINGNIKAGGENITLNVAGIVAGDKILIIHHTKGRIEVITPTAVGNGTVTGFFTGLSPVEIIKLAEAVNTENADGTVASTPTDSTKKVSEKKTATASTELSPKTGEATTIYLLMAIAMIGIAVCSKLIITKK